MKDWSVDPSHLEWTLLPWSYYISVPASMKRELLMSRVNISMGPPWRFDLTTHHTTELHLTPRNSSKGPPWRIDLGTMRECSYYGATSHSKKQLNGSTMKDWSRDPSHELHLAPFTNGHKTYRHGSFHSMHFMVMWLGPMVHRLATLHLPLWIDQKDDVCLT